MARLGVAGQGKDTMDIVKSAAPGAVQLVITFTPGDGNVNIAGPINDFILCCGLMEMAKAILLENRLKADQRIVPVTGMSIPKLGS